MNNQTVVSCGSPAPCGLAPADLTRLYLEKRSLYLSEVRRLGLESEAHDLVQDAFEKAYLHRETFSGQSQPSTWLYSIVMRTALDHLRRRTRNPVRPLVLSEDDTGELFEGEDHNTPEHVVQAKQTFNRFLRALDEAVTPAEKEVLFLRLVEHRSAREIARELDMTAQAVHTCASRALKKVRIFLAE
jgi:RNA polymerase sigma-70 factor, ECF subfamily